MNLRIKKLEAHWTSEQINIQAGIIWNYYESNGWKVGKNTMTKWHNAVSGWLYRQNWMPNQSQQKTFKQLDKEDRERAITHPEENLISIAAHRIVSTNSTEVLNGLPECLHQKALELADKLRKEQGNLPKVRMLI